MPTIRDASMNINVLSPDAKSVGENAMAACVANPNANTPIASKHAERLPFSATTICTTMHINEQISNRIHAILRGVKSYFGRVNKSTICAGKNV